MFFLKGGFVDAVADGFLDWVLGVRTVDRDCLSDCGVGHVYDVRRTTYNLRRLDGVVWMPRRGKRPERKGEAETRGFLIYSCA